MPQRLGKHALTGCDIVSHLWGIGKATAMEVLPKGQKLLLLGNENYDLRDVITEASEFVATCYGNKIRNSMSEFHYQVCLTKTARKCATKTPKLKSLPPTSESFEEHISHTIWKVAVDLDPPRRDPIKIRVEQT